MIGTGFGVAKPLFNTLAVNRSVEKSNEANNIEKTYNPLAVGSQRARKDQLSLGGGKATSLVEMLQKQRTEILDQKNKLIGSTLEKGGTIEQIGAQLDLYDEQLKNLDLELTKALLAEQEKAQEQSEAKKDAPVEEQPTAPEATLEEEVATKLNAVIELAEDLNSTKVQHKIRNKVQGEAKVLEGEIKLNKMYGMDTKSKEVKLEQLNKKIAKLDKDIGKSIAELGDRAGKPLRGPVTLPKAEATSPEPGQQPQEITVTPYQPPEAFTEQIRAMDSFNNALDTWLDESKGMGGNRQTYLNQRQKEWVEDQRVNDPQVYRGWLRLHDPSLT